MKRSWNGTILFVLALFVAGFVLTLKYNDAQHNARRAQLAKSIIEMRCVRHSRPQSQWIYACEEPSGLYTEHELAQKR